MRECIRERMHIRHVFMCPNQYVICIPALCVMYVWLVRMFIYADMSRKTRADRYCDFKERNEGPVAETNVLNTEALLDASKETGKR
jgi:hypothetical protein